MSKPFMLIQAPVETRSGYGAHARDLVKALIRMDKFDIKIVGLRWGDCPMNALDLSKEEDKAINDRIIRGQINLPTQPDINVEIRVPNEFQRVGKYNIGITAGMETTLVSPEWIEGCNRMDLIIVPSEHSRNVFLQSSWEKLQDTPQGKQKVGDIKLEKPIEVLFEGAEEEIFKPTKNIPSELEETLNTIKEPFGFLYVGHWLRGELGQDRKDTGMLVKVFLETFKNKKNPPALIMKTSSATFSIMDRDDILQRIENIKKTIDGVKKFPPIYVLHGDLTDEEMNGLYNHPKVKASVSFTKGEGFGRPLLEATFADKLVIASNWSGHIDFLDSKLSVMLPGKLNPVHESSVWDKVILKESQWFTANYAYASKVLTDVWMNYPNYEKRAKKQGMINRKKFTLSNMKNIFVEIVDKYIPSFESKLQLPKLRKVGESNNLPKIKLPKLKKTDSTTIGA